MNPAETNQVSTSKIDTSCQLPLLVLFGGAATWLFVGLLLAILASLIFHNPDMLAACPFMTYGHLVAAANDLLVYGFAVQAALGVILWILARLSRVELELPLLSFLAGNLWNVGVVLGLIAIITGHSSGFLWLEFPRVGAMLIGVSFVLIAISAFATFGQRRERELYPSHWFLLGALLWFPWIYSTANLFVVTTWPVRGMAQQIIDWWFANNLVFVWLSLAGLGIAFYFLPKISGRPLFSHFYALFAFWTLMLFGTWLGIPQGAPVPAWFPATSTLAAVLLVFPLAAVAVIWFRTTSGAKVDSFGGPYCYMKFGALMFLVSSVMLMALSCPKYGMDLELTWFAQAQVQLQLFGFAAMILIGAINYIFPLAMGRELPKPKFVQLQFFFTLAGTLIYVVSLVIAGLKQSATGYDPAAAKIWLQVSTAGLTLLFVGSLLLFINIMVMTVKWKLGLVSMAIAAIKAPLETSEVKS
jgi:cytochrome c oxidase cbb3-type subunit 1